MFAQELAPTVFDSKSNEVIGESALAGNAERPTRPPAKSREAVNNDVSFLTLNFI
jgi:hypothetical protein